MPANTQAPTKAGTGESSKGPHRMRIASGGHISQYVAFALQFLKDHPDRPLVLHTIPPPPPTSEPADGQAESSVTGLAKSLLATPKLISVVELIKRKHMESLSSSGGKGKNKAVGIWQYTTSGLLPHAVKDAGEEDVGLEAVLAGRTKPALRHSPYLEITLSTRPLGLEDSQRDTTCQYVMLRHRHPRGVREPSPTQEASVAVRKDQGQTEKSQVVEGESNTVDSASKQDAVEAKGKKRKVGSQASASSAGAWIASKKQKSRG